MEVSNARNIPFFFGIPLRSATTSMNWNRVVSNLERTLSGIEAQTDPRFGVIIACHEVPDFLPRWAAKVPFPVWITSAEGCFPPPADKGGFGRDKRLKRELVGKVLKETGADGFYFMNVDADDLIRNDLVEMVLRHDNRLGYLFSAGYLFDAETQQIALYNSNTRFFYDNCGTCSVLFFRKEDLVLEGKSEKTVFSNFGSHSKQLEESMRIGRPLKLIDDDYYVLYYFNNGENNRVVRGLAKGKMVHLRSFRTDDPAHRNCIQTMFPSTHL